MKRLRQFLIHSVGTFARKRLVVAGSTLLLGSRALIGAAAGDLLIPSPEPGVEREYDDTFRVLASNDPDPGRGSSVVQVYEYGENGTIREVNRTVGTQPVQLWDSNIQSRDALLIANESDMYQSGLSGFVQVPYRDQWTPLRDWWGGEFRILPIYTGDPSRATSTDGQYTVEVRHPNGWWNPVYNADVERVDGNLTVTNTDEALVLSSYYSTVIDRKIQIIESLLQHSEMAPSDSAARSTSVVPTQNGVEVFPTTDGADVALQWQSGSHALVRDAYVGNIDVIRRPDSVAVAVPRPPPGVPAPGPLVSVWPTDCPSCCCSPLPPPEPSPSPAPIGVVIGARNAATTSATRQRLTSASCRASTPASGSLVPTM